MDRDLDGRPRVRGGGLFEFLASTSGDAGRGSNDQTAPQGGMAGRPLEVEESSGGISMGAGALENSLKDSRDRRPETRSGSEH